MFTYTYTSSLLHQNVEPDHNPTIVAFSNPVNAQKNRYGNIKCCEYLCLLCTRWNKWSPHPFLSHPSDDHSRVRLTATKGTAGSDYINGNFLDVRREWIVLHSCLQLLLTLSFLFPTHELYHPTLQQGYKQPNAFIATQGPVPGSVVDFWRMVWEQDAPTIVMLTKLEEKGRIKCHRYWPIERTSMYGSIRVTIQEELEFPDYTVRTFSVIMVRIYVGVLNNFVDRYLSYEWACIDIAFLLVLHGIGHLVSGLNIFTLFVAFILACLLLSLIFIHADLH